VLSVVILGLFCVVMLFIIASVSFSAWRERQQYKYQLETQQSLSAPDPRVAAILQLQDGPSVAVKRSTPISSFLLSSKWYKRRRMLVSLGLLLMMGLALGVQDGLTDGTLHAIFTKNLGITLFQSSQPQTLQLGTHTAPLSPSSLLVRVDSALRNEYHTDYQWQVWAYSSCSGIAMEMVMNAYGRHLIAADVMEVEDRLGVWNVNLGLLRDDGIALTADQFGFDATLSHTQMVEDVVALANKGKPVIVSVRDSTYFPGGHLFVIRGGDNGNVYIADSSPANFTRMTYTRFAGMWQGFSAVLTPQSGIVFKDLAH